MGDETVSSTAEKGKIPGYKGEKSLESGDTIKIGESAGYTAMIGGRLPQARELKVDIPENCLAVELKGTSFKDTSRVQFEFNRDQNSNFYIKNMSREVPIHTKSILNGKAPLGPGRSISVGNRVDQLQGMEIYWDRFLLKQDGLIGESSGGGWTAEFKYFVRK